MAVDEISEQSVADSTSVVEKTHKKVTLPYYNEDYKPSRALYHLSKMWDTFGKEPSERALVAKLDVFLFLYGILAYIVKSLDTSNISNAYVSGMKEDLNVVGNEYNYMSTSFTIGYMAGAIPAQLIMNRVRPSIFIPCCTLTWTAFVMAMAGAKSPTLIYICRAIIGVAEGGLFPSISWLIGSWYMPDELAKRMVTFELASQMAAMFSGYIQAGLYSSMNGVGGLAGWRWLFIFDGVISIPIGLFGIFALPDFPHNTRAMYLTKRDREIALMRVENAGRKPPKKLGVKGWIGIFSSWKIYAFIMAFSTPAINGATGYFNLWLKSLDKYSVQMINIIPTGGNAISIVYGFVFSWVSDWTRIRWPLILLSVIPPLVGCIMLSVWDIAFGAKMAAFFLLFASSASQPLTLVWATELFQDSTEMRGALTAAADTFTNAILAWLPVVAYPAAHAPEYKGYASYKMSAGMIGAQIVGVLNLAFWARWEQRRKGVKFNEFGLPIVERDEEEEYNVEVEVLEGSGSDEVGDLEKGKEHIVHTREI
ncbi:putative pantothenate transporter [Myxozyma melibiosi]|uniref:Pantothenate transporter n=1 Tax=Myxozyma melibiosi TaxID=54550 RepID=A0ABR1EZK5_9ASCO